MSTTNYEHVVALQAFLMNGARRYAPAPPTGEPNPYLVAAASLDYAVLVASGVADDRLDRDAALASMRIILAKAARAAIELARVALERSPAIRAEFFTLDGGPGGILTTLDALARDAMLADPDLSFEIIALRADVHA